MTIVPLAVLGALEQLGQGSGYDIAQYLERKMISRWADIKQASVYHALRQLEKDQSIRPVREEREGRLPPKTIYELTDAGRAVFDELQAAAFRGIYPRFFGFKIALKFNTRRSAAEIRAFAAEAIEIIDRQLAAMDSYLAALDPAQPQHAYDGFFIDHDRQLFLAERQWISAAAERAESVRTAFDRPDAGGE